MQVCNNTIRYIIPFPNWCHSINNTNPLLVLMWRGKSQATTQQEREHSKHKDKLDIKERFD